jgi:hypothetical protein
MFMMLPKGTCLLITFALQASCFPTASTVAFEDLGSRQPPAHTNKGRALKLEITFHGGAFALAAALLLSSACGYFGWHTFKSGLELREQTKWIKAIATGADEQALDVPAADRYGVALMAQAAKTSGLSEADWQTFEDEATKQLRSGALYMAGSILLACLAIERSFRKSRSRSKLLVVPAASVQAKRGAPDRQQDA